MKGIPYIIVRRSDGTRIERPRDMPRYDGRGASKALLRAYFVLKGAPRSTHVGEMVREQVARESERAA